MRWPVWVGIRYIRSRRQKRFISFVATLSLFGVGIGVTAMVVVLSVMGGFERELKKRLLSGQTHLLVERITEQAATSPVLTALKSDPRVSGVHAVATTEAILKHGRRVAGVVLKGWEPAELARLKGLLVESEGEAISQDSLKLPSLWVGKELGYSLGLMPGDLVSLVSPLETSGPLEVAPRVMRFRVSGIYQAGTPDQELTTLWTDASAVSEFLRKSDVVNAWEATLVNPDDSTQVLASIGRDSSLRIQDWKQLNASLFASLKLERTAMFIVLLFIVVVASFNIVSTLSMMVVERKKELSILRAMGAAPADLRTIVLTQGTLIGGGGVVGGVILGAILVSLLDRYEFIKLPDIYLDRTLPVVFDPLAWCGIALAAIVIVLVSSLIPATRALAITPMDGIANRK